MQKSVSYKMEKEKPRRKSCEIPGIRYLFAVNGFIGFVVLFALRTNINVALVAMVNGTAVYDHKNTTQANECPNPDANSSSSNGQKDGPFIWSPVVQGHVLASFFYGYVVSQIPGGMLADRYSGKWVFAVGTLLTSLLTLLTPVSANHSVTALIINRVLQGFAQGVTMPAMNTLLGRWLPDTEKGFLNTVVHAGVNVGAMVAMPLAGVLSESNFLGGWPSVFYVMGTCGVLWLLMWCALVTDTPQGHPFISNAELRYIESNQNLNKKTEVPPIPWSKVLKSVPFWTLILCRVCQDWSYYTLTTDLPTYFATILYFPLQENGFFSSFPHLLQTIFGVIVTLCTDYLQRRRYFSTIGIRKVCNSLSGFGGALGLLGVCFAGCNIAANKLCFILAIGMGSFCYSGHMLTFFDMSPEYVGTLLGLSNTISNLTGFLTPLVVGALTEKQQTFAQWRIVFGITAGLLSFATACFVLFGTAQKQDWADRTAAGRESVSQNQECCAPEKRNYKLLRD